MAGIWLFLQAVFTHWIFWVGILLTLSPFSPKGLKQWGEKKMKREFSLKHLWAVGALLLVVAFYQAWYDEHRNTEVVIAERAAAVGLENSCVQDARIRDAFSRGLQTANGELQDSLNREQGLFGKQQTTVNSCVLSLAKTNPKVSEIIRVSPILLWAREPSEPRRHIGPLLAPNHPNAEFVWMLLITTNQPQSRFHGVLECEGSPFSVLGKAEAIPRNANDDENIDDLAITHEMGLGRVELETSLTGKEWSPEYPVYVPIFTVFKNIVGCTFTPD